MMITMKEGGYQMKAAIIEGCIGCSLCAATCPNVFQMTDDGVAEVYAVPEPADEAATEEAAQNCPVSVIIIET